MQIFKIEFTEQGKQYHCILGPHWQDLCSFRCYILSHYPTK